MLVEPARPSRAVSAQRPGVTRGDLARALSRSCRCFEPSARRLISDGVRDGRRRASKCLGPRVYAFDVSDRTMALRDAASVEPWRPLTADVDASRTWHEWLERREVVEPFEQVPSREIFVLAARRRARRAATPDRFATHVVEQHQFAALCRARSSRYQLRAGLDDADAPTQ